MHKPLPLLAIAAAIQLLTASAPAQAQSQSQTQSQSQDTARHTYQLAVAPLDQTLLRIAAGSGVALAYDPALLASVRSAPVNGSYSPVEAITRALQGTGFELALAPNGRSLTVRRVAALPAPLPVARPAGPPMLQVALRQPVAAAAVATAAAPAEAVSRVTISGARRSRLDSDGADAQRTPTSSYRIGGDEIDEQNVTTLEDLQQLVPGLVIQSTDPSDTQISIRGVGDGGGQSSGDANIGMSSSVAIYVDNVYLARPGMLGNGLGDLAYAEVLSGAQGTMFGANATGGVLDIHTRAPSATPEASASVSYGEHGYARARAMVSGPLSPAWAGRLNLVYSDNDGGVTNLRDGAKLNGASSGGARGQLLYQPGGKFSLRLSADYNDTSSKPTPVLLATNTFAGKDTFLTHSALVGNDVVFGPRVDLDDINRVHVSQGGVAAKADWKFDGGYQLRSVTSYRYFKSTPTMADGLSVAVYANTGTQVLDRSWTQTLRLDSPAGPRYDYALGLDYLGQNLATAAHTRYAAGTLAGLYYDSKSYNGLDVIRLGTLHDQMLSPFVQGTLHLARDWDLTGGARVNYEEKGGQFIRYNKAAFNSGYLKEYHALPSGTLVLKYQLTPGWSSYLAGSYGEKSGGINVSAGAAGKAGNDSLYIKPEKTKSAELGLKGALWDNRVALKADVFVTEISDFQTQGYNPEDQQTYLMNAGSFRSRGAETTLRLALSRNLKLDFAAVYNDAYYTDYANARCAPEVTLSAAPPASCNLTGQRLFNAPKITWNASARYAWRSDAGLNNFVSARYAYRGWMYGTVDNSSLTRVSSYGLAAFAAGTGGKLQRGDWSASVWVNNAFNKTYYRREVNGDYGSVWGWLGDARTIGATIGYQF